MQHIEFLLEEQSMEAALEALLPKILPGRSFALHPHEGKPDLLRNLSAMLRSYRRWLPTNSGIVVLVDEDRQDCRELKAELERAAARAGFCTRSSAQGRRFQVVNWIAIEELEAWFFGDVPALVRAYPRVPATLDRKAGFRDPDAIRGGTWEALERILQQAGYHRGGLSKIAAARDIAAHMEPGRNRSRSFNGFVRAVRQAAAQGR
jgi:hypothetical protein